MDIILTIFGILLLVVAHEFGHFSLAKLLKIKVEEFGVGLPPRVFGKKYKETIYSVNALPLGGFVKIYGEENPEEEDKEAFLNKPFGQKALVVLGGIVANLVVGWILLSLVFMVGAPQKLVITDVLPDSPAYKEGIKKGDIVLRVSVGDYLLEEPILAEELVKLVKDSQSEEINMSVKRGNEEFAFTIKNRAIYGEKENTLGIVLQNVGIEKLPFLAALQNGFNETIILVRMMVEGIFILVRNVFTAEPVLKNLAGPVGIVSFAVQTAAFGKVYLLQLLGLISINLAVVNLIPIPALDGGRFLVYLIEKLRGKKIKGEIQSLITGLSFVLLLLLMVVITYNDIKNIFQ